MQGKLLSDIVARAIAIEQQKAQSAVQPDNQVPRGRGFDFRFERTPNLWISAGHGLLEHPPGEMQCRARTVES